MPQQYAVDRCQRTVVLAAGVTWIHPMLLGSRVGEELLTTAGRIDERRRSPTVDRQIGRRAAEMSARAGTDDRGEMNSALCQRWRRRVQRVTSSIWRWLAEAAHKLVVRERAGSTLCRGHGDRRETHRRPGRRRVQHDFGRLDGRSYLLIALGVAKGPDAGARDSID